MPDAFISYHSEDQAAVAIIAEELKKLKLDVWFDAALRSGSAYDSQISQQLESAKAVLACWTPGAVKSDWVRAEADFARTRDKLVPCVLQPIELPPPFNLVEAPNLSAWAGQDDDPAWLKILERPAADRPAIAPSRAVMRPAATLPELKAWVGANAIDPLSSDVWRRITALEGENAEQKAAREASATAAREQLRKFQAKRSRELAKARGLRDPAPGAAATDASARRRARLGGDFSWLDRLFDRSRPEARGARSAQRARRGRRVPCSQLVSPVRTNAEEKLGKSTTDCGSTRKRPGGRPISKAMSMLFGTAERASSRSSRRAGRRRSGGGHSTKSTPAGFASRARRRGAKRSNSKHDRAVSASRRVAGVIWRR